MDDLVHNEGHSNLVIERLNGAPLLHCLVLLILALLDDVLDFDLWQADVLLAMARCRNGRRIDNRRRVDSRQQRSLAGTVVDRVVHHGAVADALHLLRLQALGNLKELGLERLRVA